MTKYSDLIFSNKVAESSKSAIKKLEKSGLVSADESVIKVAKKDYVKAVVGVPEFDQAVAHLSKYTMEKGTQQDKENMKSLLDKINAGDFEYDDVGKLALVCDNNFKYLFAIEPEQSNVNPTVITGGILVLCAIILRASYEFVDNIALVVFLTLINFVAMGYTFITWHSQTMEQIDEWLKCNNMPAVFRDKITNQVSKKTTWTIICMAFAMLAWIAAASILGRIALGNDIVSIVSLGVSILSPQIVKKFAIHFEKNIYHNYA